MPISTIIIVIGLVACVAASPVPGKKAKDEYADAKVVYDQRQEGEWNVRAHLDNFVIMIIPSQSTSGGPPSPGLLDLLTKSAPKRAKQAPKRKTPDAALETMHFIESKAAAPYHVDLTAKEEGTEEVVALGEPGRRSRHLVVALPMEGDYVITKSKKPTAGKKGKEAKGTRDKEELVLLGAENEQCGPGMARDSYGICRVYKKY